MRDRACTPGIDGPALTIRQGFDRYEQLPYWIVSRSSKESACFQAWIYGNRAEFLARQFYRAIVRGVPWAEAYERIPQS